MASNRAVDVLKDAMVARYPLVAVFSFEEERVEATLRHVARASGVGPVWTWSCTQGLANPEGAIEPETQAPLGALRFIAQAAMPVCLMRDLSAFYDDPQVVRTLRDLRRQLAARGRMLFLQSAPGSLPRELRRDVATVDFPLPQPVDLERAVTRRTAQLGFELSDEERALAVTALRGLTLNEAGHALNLAFHGRQRFDEETLTALHEIKAQLARKDGVLEYVPRRWNIDDVGGLPVLKDWLGKRLHLIEDESELADGLVPRGVLMMGVPGCGKSLSVKAVSAYWHLPLFRLDMGQVFAGVNGGPEESFARALRMMEAVAPAILWIDEIENGISAETEGADAGVKGRIFATFLTWMQEKPPRIFVAATANRIDKLPAELLRKGRFDQVFFIDLPSEDERAQIFQVHLDRRGVPRSTYDAVTLAKATRNWNGAEIEQCVVAAMTEAYARREDVVEHDLFVQISQIVPLSTTMAEQIKAIRSWALQRAIRAS